MQRKEIFVDPAMQAYVDGLGFDRESSLAGKAVKSYDQATGLPQWLTPYYNQQQTQRLSFPIVLPGIGKPTSALFNAARASAQNGPATTGLKRLFLSKQPVGYSQAYSENMLEDNLTVADASQYIQMAKEAMLFASRAGKLWDGHDSGLKKYAPLLADGSPTQPSLYDESAYPADLLQIQGRYKEDLAKILPFAERDQTYRLLSFAHGLAENGQPTTNIQNQIARQPLWQASNAIARHAPTEGDRRQMLMDTVSKQIYFGKKLPLKVQFQQDKLPPTKTEHYLYQQKARALSRFSEQY